jgi:signal transduction histidine kinase
MLSPTTSMAAKKADLRDFLWNNSSFLCSTQPAVVYPVPIENTAKGMAYGGSKSRTPQIQEPKAALSVSNGPELTVLAQKGGGQQQASANRYLKEPIQVEEVAKDSSDRNQGTLGRANSETLKKSAAAPASTSQAPAAASAQIAGAASNAEARGREFDAAKLEAVPKELAVAVPPANQARVPMNRGLVELQGELKDKVDAPSLALPLPTPAAPPVLRPAPAPAPLAPAPGRRIAVTNPAKGPPEVDSLRPDSAPTSPAAPASKPMAAEPAAPTAPTPAAPAVVADPMPKIAQHPQVATPATGGIAGSTQQLTEGIVPGGKADSAQVTAENLTLQPTKPAEPLGLGGGAQPRSRAVTPEADPAEDQKQSVSNPDAVGNSQSYFALNTAPSQQTSLFSRANPDALNRMVEPQQQLRSAASNWSAILPATADFRALTGDNDEGMLARFVQDKLDLVFWIRPPESPEMVFGCLIEAGDLDQLWKDLFASRIAENRSERPPYVLALLNDKAKPVATFPVSESGREWKRPFVADEVGEVLPHWEAALYLATPTAMADTARGLRRTLSFTIAGAIALIAIGGWLVVHDVRRQLALAQQKTDFVSNVSHELKTPLTSIRMFAELMHDRPPAPEKQGQYLRIIRVEAERLTRLINNVLDFAKLERRQKRFDKKPLDLCSVITRVWEGQEMHLRDAGFTTRWQAAPGPYPVQGDEDALAQILVNLLSNAEKYSQERKDIELVTWIEGDSINASVLDRGIGIPDGEEKKIFEAFYRAHDSLSSGIQGSGLGLTLAQRLAREHGGEIVFERRQDGGCRFTFRMPLVAHDSGSCAAQSVDETGTSGA